MQKKNKLKFEDNLLNLKVIAIIYSINVFNKYQLFSSQTGQVIYIIEDYSPEFQTYHMKSALFFSTMSKSGSQHMFFLYNLSFREEVFQMYIYDILNTL
jgi:hypothetical protein